MAADSACQHPGAHQNVVEIIRLSCNGGGRGRSGTELTTIGERSCRSKQAEQLSAAQLIDLHSYWLPHKVLWDSQRWGVQFRFNKFNPTVIDGGHIYVPSYNGGVDVYQLTNP